MEGDTSGSVLCTAIVQVARRLRANSAVSSSFVSHSFLRVSAIAARRPGWSSEPDAYEDSITSVAALPRCDLLSLNEPTRSAADSQEFS